MLTIKVAEFLDESTTKITNTQHMNREKWCFVKISSVINSSWIYKISIRSLSFNKIQSVRFCLTTRPTKSENPSTNSFHNFSLSVSLSLDSRSPRREWSSELFLVWIGQSVFVKKLTQHRVSIMVIHMFLDDCWIWKRGSDWMRR
jgi:hypothetical protein